MDICDWDIDMTDCCDAFDELSEALQDQVVAVATELLWNWSGRRYGVCETTVYPCRAELPTRGSTFSGPRSYRPILIDGQWWNVLCGECLGACGCGLDESRAIVLPGNVAEVQEIWLGGELLDPSEYSLNDGIIFLTSKRFPEFNQPYGDVSDPDSGAWKIVYDRGYPVPAGGVLAAQTLACEFAKSICNDKDCQLPKRVQSVTRQGVTVAVLDAFENLEEGRTGIWEIDSWLAAISFNTGSPAQVYSPDIPKNYKSGLAAGLGFGGRQW